MSSGALVAVGSQAEMVRLLRPYVGEELASPQVTDWLLPGGGVFRERIHPSEFVRNRSEPGERPGELYERMLRTDSDLAGLCEKRAKAVLALPHYIQPRDASPLAREVAAFVRQGLDVVPQRLINLSHALTAIPSGVAVEELIWEQIGRGPLAGAWLPVEIIDRPIRRFGFQQEDGRLFVRRRTGLPVVAPPAKFAVHTYGTKDTPWGAPLLDKLYWFWFVKRHALKYWAVFVERFAQPLLQGHYKHRGGDDPQAKAFNEEQQRTLLAAMQEMRTGTAIALPEGLVISYLEATRSGDASYPGFVGFLDRAMALLILGEVDTSGLAKGPGSFAKSRVSNEVRLETLEYDASLLGSWETDTVLRWIVLANFGPEAPVPVSVYDSTDATDRKERRAGIDAAFNAGQPVPRAYFLMTNQVPDVLDGDDVIEPPARTAPVPVPPATPVHASALRLAAADPLQELVRRRDADFERVVEAFVPLTFLRFEAHRERALTLWEEGSTDLGRLLDAGAVVAHAEALEAAQIHGMGFALLHLQEDLETASTARLTDPGSFEQWVTPVTAIEFWARLLGISKDVFNRLSDAARRLAFAVAGLKEGSLLADVHRLLGRALAEGMKRGDFVEALDALYERHGVTPTSPHHAGLIYGNNVRQAAGVVRWLQTVGNPQVHALMPYLHWWTIDDEDVRARPAHNHQVMHGFVAAIGHEIWKTWWSPAGHGCRCGIGTISRAEARRRGLVGAEPFGPWPLADGVRALPDPGFRGAPDLGGVADRIETKLSDLFEEAEAGGSSALVEALLTLFKLLGLLFLGRPD